jgi:dGTPase
MPGQAGYAVTEENSRGRAFSENAHPYRAAFERDRDRVIHSSAFRRLEGKTQVFTPGLDDFYRTRLTHTIEVAQIGRTLAKALGLNEDLTEAICLAHDLGHPPFGHTGEKVLNELMAAWGGFEHNRQGLRIITLLEHPYPQFVGLNLMYETRLGLAKHRTLYDEQSEEAAFAEPCPSLEGQVADLADRIAYNCHDLEDGRRARLVTGEQARLIPLVAQAERDIGIEAIDDYTIRRTRTSKAIINRLVGDCLSSSRKALAGARIQRLEDVYEYGRPLIALSDEGDAQVRQLEQFLLDHFYLHPTLLATAEQVRQWLSQLFNRLVSSPELMPRYFQRFIPEYGLQRAVADYIAGMTDRFCLKMLQGEERRTQNTEPRK